ncbi:MAG: DNA polymerase III subunit gamma/tau [Candidatus Izemoplasmataceae bacterium]
MAYKALYRTYRPRDFDEIAGQEHITRTFKNALSKNKLAHAYLFSGPRGTGKTSVAKIIAKAVNCENAPVKNPCNTCDVCQGIENNTINDVIEIDAASNNGVDEIREIRDKVKYLPGVANYKVYIIDEVHMLSTGAFNALLKTLEEPPKHAIFILATTEPHKVPATIHSRCQRFDFRGIQSSEMLKRLELIIDKESIEIDEDAKRLIVESSAGGMRDAISLLDQVMAFSEGPITKDAIHAIRGTVAEETILEIAKAIRDEDAVKALHALNRLIEDGKESQNIINDLITFYRDVLYVKNTDDHEGKSLFGLSAFKDLSESSTNPELFHYMDILNETKQAMRFATDGKMYLELAFIKMVDDVLKEHTRDRQAMNETQAAIEKLEKKVESLESAMNEAPMKPEPSSSEAESSSPADKVFDALENQTHRPNIEPASKRDDSVRVPSFLERETKEDNGQGEAPSKPEAEPEETGKKKEEASGPKDKFGFLYEKYSKKHYRTFDIHYVEDVLNTGDREIKIDMVKKWYDIERFVDADDLDYAKMITDGTLVATNGVMNIVTYDSPVVCNRLMQPSIKQKLIAILESFFGRRMMFMALPKDVWERISKEFIKKFRRQEDASFITLEPIDHPRLVEIPQEEKNYDDVTSSGIKEAKKYFGDIVKEKKGE